MKSKAVILMYHRVVNLPDYPYPIVVSLERFRQHIQYVRDSCYPISLIDFACALEQRSLPKRAVAITFDDGYGDNYRYAYPILEEFDVPATIFVASNYVDTESEFWWDDLERILVSPAQVPPRLSIRLGDAEYKWEMDSLPRRKAARKEIHQLMKPLHAGEREKTLAELAGWAGLTRRGRAVNQAMTSKELRQLAQSHIIDIGAHTISHPQLSALPPQMQYNEIIDGRRQLELIIDAPVRTFAYPYGALGHYTKETVEIVKSAGFAAACTTEDRRVVYGSDLHQLPRYSVDDWDLGMFGKYLEGFFHNQTP